MMADEPDTEERRRRRERRADKALEEKEREEERQLQEQLKQIRRRAEDENAKMQGEYSFYSEGSLFEESLDRTSRLSSSSGQFELDEETDVRPKDAAALTFIPSQCFPPNIFIFPFPIQKQAIRHTHPLDITVGRSRTWRCGLGARNSWW